MGFTPQKRFRDKSIFIACLLLVAACGSSKESISSKKPEKITDQTQPQNEAGAPVVQGPTKIITTRSGMQMKIAANRAETINPKLIYAYQGKGTALTWDIGGTKAAYERMSLLRRETNPAAQTAGDIVVTGNSSGSVLAAWFTCRGFTAESIREAQTIMTQFPASLVKESTSEKILEIISAIKQGREFGAPINPMIPLVDHITGKGSCVPQLPTIITTSITDCP